MGVSLSHEIVAAYQSGLSMHECARRFGMSRTSLSYRLKKAGIRIKQKAEVIAEQYADAPWRNKDQMLDLYERQGKSTIEIAEMFGCDRSVVTDWLNRFGATMRTTAETQKGKEPATKGKGKRNSTETVLCACGCGTSIKRYSFSSSEVRFASGHRIHGADHPRYKPNGGRRTDRHDRADYRVWRREVLAANSYTCAVCGVKGGKLHSHHVLPFSKFPQYRYEVTNGLAMCKPYHIETHKVAREIM